MNNIPEINQSFESKPMTNENVKMNRLSNGASNNFEDEVIYLFEIKSNTLFVIYMKISCIDFIDGRYFYNSSVTRRRCTR